MAHVGFHLCGGERDPLHEAAFIDRLGSQDGPLREVPGARCESHRLGFSVYTLSCDGLGCKPHLRTRHARGPGPHFPGNP